MSLGTGIPIQPRHSMTTRFFLTCISSYYFHKDVTLDGLHDFIANDAANLYHNGLEAPCMYKHSKLILFVKAFRWFLFGWSMTVTFRSASH